MIARPNDILEHFDSARCSRSGLLRAEAGKGCAVLSQRPFSGSRHPLRAGFAHDEAENLSDNQRVGVASLRRCSPSSPEWCSASPESPFGRTPRFALFQGAETGSNCAARRQGAATDACQAHRIVRVTHEFSARAHFFDSFRLEWQMRRLRSCASLCWPPSTTTFTINYRRRTKFVSGPRNVGKVLEIWSCQARLSSSISAHRIPSPQAQ